MHYVIKNIDRECRQVSLQEMHYFWQLIAKLIVIIAGVACENMLWVYMCSRVLA